MKLISVDSARLHPLNELKIPEGSAAGSGAVCYWMSRDQRLHDNWALLYAQQKAAELQVPVVIVFVLLTERKSATLRSYGFMVEGLKEVAQDAAQKHIPFVVLAGDPVKELLKFVKEVGGRMMVTDFTPLAGGRRWRSDLSSLFPVPFVEVDAHNIVPVWRASEKAEFAARTIRPKITALLPHFLTDFPQVRAQEEQQAEEVVKKVKGEVGWKGKKVDWDTLMKKVQMDATVKEVVWIRAGEAAADEALHEFIEHRLENYDTDRNDPTKNGQSNLSPYLHFGQLSAQRVALEVSQAADRDKKLRKSADAFLEELIIRRELSDNFCFYTPGYNTPKAWPKWAKATLDAHRDDPREHLYSIDELEHAQTEDPAWNAAQRELLERGKIHGYMRMYWAKKILEWSKTPDQALHTAIYLNDKYLLDGRDPNGYVGIQWSIAGLHDRPWFERPIFGTIRYMNYNGLKRKFDIGKYLD
jgi:deoxyribodipyrimidine photo-lyase